MTKGTSRGSYNFGRAYLDITKDTDVKIIFAKEKDHLTVSEKSIGIIKQIASASNNPSVYITSSVRSPEDQARIMYNDTVTLGMTQQYILYGPNGDKVIDVYKAMKELNKSREDIIKAMERKIYELGPSKVSLHCGNHNVLNVFDISSNGAKLRNPKDFLSQAYLHKEISKILNESERNCYHIEIKQ